MTDNEIIKAIGHCLTDLDCLDCPYVDYEGKERCDEKVLNDLCDLINRQKAEIERLEQNLKEAHIDIKEHQAHIRNLKIVIDKNEDHINPLPFETDYDKAIRQAKAEVVRDFAERIRNSAYESEVVAFIGKVYTISETAIKNAIKETAGAENG